MWVALLGVINRWVGGTLSKIYCKKFEVAVKKLIHDEFFDIKDSKWDCDDRHKIKWHIVNLSNGKNKLLKGWKTSYTNDSVEDTNSNWYTKIQIKALERSLI